MKQNVNYIVHHKEVFIRMMDQEVTAIDISIYNALFLLWNNSEFDTKLSINRNEVMMMSKVGNVNTYTKSLRKLDSLGFIKYFPSNNPMKGSIITMYRFDNSSDNSSEQSNGYTDDNSSDNSSVQGGDTLYKPIKLNKPIKLIKQKEISENVKIGNVKIDNSEVELIFDTENFKVHWQLWKSFKKQTHKFKYLNTESEQRALNTLKKLCNDNEETAISIILQSIDNGWKGFFPLKNQSNQSKEILQTSNQGKFNVMG